MSDLAGARVLLSASFPSRSRGERFRPYDASAIAAAVTAVTQAVLTARGTLVFGGHPTISPLVLLVASEIDRPHAVVVYQSSTFEGRVPKETLDLFERGLGELRWTDEVKGDLTATLALMRREMLSREPLAAGIFIGGMEGVHDEYTLLGQLQPTVPRLPVTAPGGAARQLTPGPDPVSRSLVGRLSSPLYPALARDIVTAISRADIH